MCIESFTVEDGLSSHIITEVLQDRQGFLWVGTTDGLNRYDGQQFKVFRHALDEPQGLQDNVCNALYEDPAGTLWVGANNGLYRYHPDSETFTAYLSQPDVPGKLNGIVLASMLTDPSGKMWLSSYSCGLHRFDPVHERFQAFYPDSSWENYQQTTYTSQIGVGRDNSYFWVAMSSPAGWKLYRVDTQSGILEPFEIEGLVNGHLLFPVLEDRRGNVWLGSSAGLFRLDHQKSICRKVTDGSIPSVISEKRITEIFEDRSGVLWFGTYTDGLYTYDPASRQTKNYRHDPADAESLASNTIKCIVQDRSGVVWVGTTGKGLSKFVPDIVKFQCVFEDKGAPTGYNATAIYEDRKGITWVGTGNDLIAWDRKTGQVRHLKEQFPDIPLFRFETYTLLEDRKGNLWAGGNSTGSVRLNPERTKCTCFKNDPANAASLVSNYVRDIYEDRDGILWFSTYEGLDRFDPGTEQFIHYRNDPNQPDGLPGRFILNCMEDSAGRFWVTSDQGITLMDRKTGRFRSFLRGEKDPNSLNSSAVICQYVDHTGLIWLGTSSGLYLLHPPEPRRSDWTTTYYTRKDGLPNNKITGILEDNQGQLWLSTNSGFSVFQNPRHDAQTRPVFHNYNMKNGLPGMDFVDGASYKNSRGELFFGNWNGLIYFHPDSLHNNTLPPKVAITGFEKFDTDAPEKGAIAEKGLAARPEIVLSYKNNLFSIEFAALDFREPEKNRYEYRMLGFNDHWIYLGAQRRVTFTNLDPGTYTFQVRGSNNDGVWSEAPATLKITITPPWWKTTSAYAAYILLLLAAVTGFVHARVRYLENRTRQLEAAVTLGTAKIQEQKAQMEVQAGELKQLDQLKTRFYANITHELRTPLTLILGPLKALMKTLDKDSEQGRLLGIARGNGEKLLKLISEILDLGKLDANKIFVEETATDLRALLARLVALFDSNAMYRGVELSCQYELPPGKAYLLDAAKFETVVNNLLSNALKFTGAGGAVRLAMTEQAETLLLTITDTGRGIHPDDLPHIFDRYYQSKRPDVPVEGGTGIGLALCSELVHLAGGRIWAESTPGAGSVFFVEWPKKEATAETGRLVHPGKEVPVIAEDMFPPPFDAGGTGGVPHTSGLLGNTGSAVPDAVPKILIVEDNPDLQQYLYHLLSPLYEATIAGNGKEALALLSNTAPDLLISDIMMPHMDGFQLLERLKAADDFRHIPVVMLTARADIQDKLRALRIGVDDYLTKPFEEEELLARVENLLQRRQNRRLANAEGQTAAAPRISQADNDWLAELEAWTQENLQNEFLNVSTLAQQAALSERQLLRRLRELTGLSPQQYISEMRLQKARTLLEQGAFRTVAEAAYAAGFSHPKVFSRVYRTRFGRLPSGYF